MQLQGSTVLVTGSTGFVGGHVREALAARGARVVPFARGSGAASGDVRDRAALDRAMRSVDAVVHLAVSPGYRAEGDPRWDAEVNIIGTLNMLLAAGAQGVRRVLHVSSAHVYGSTRPLVSEDDPPWPTSLYGVSKLASEEYARMFARARGLRVSVVRLAALYGEAVGGDAPPNVVTRFVDLALADRPIVIAGDPQGRLDLLHVRDAAAGCILALEKEGESGRIHNLGGAEPVTIAELATLAIGACGSRSIVEAGPPQPSTLLPLLDIARARRELGFTPSIDVATGVAAFAAARRTRRSASEPRP